jgi:hypothetical protein
METRVLTWREPKEAFAGRRFSMWLWDLLWFAIGIWLWIRVAQQKEWLNLALVAPIAGYILWSSITPHIREFYTLSATGIHMFPGILGRHIKWRDVDSFSIMAPNYLQLRRRKVGKFQIPVISLPFDSDTISADSLRQFISDYLPEKDHVAQWTEAIQNSDLENQLLQPAPEVIRQPDGTISALQWKEAPPETVGPKWQLPDITAVFVFAIAFRMLTLRDWTSLLFALLLVGAIIYAKGLPTHNRIDTEGISVRHIFQRRRLRWRQVKRIRLYQHPYSSTCRLRIESKRRWRSLELYIESPNISEDDLRDYINKLAPSVPVS